MGKIIKRVREREAAKELFNRWLEDSKNRHWEATERVKMAVTAQNLDRNRSLLYRVLDAAPGEIVPIPPPPPRPWWRLW